MDRYLIFIFTLDSMIFAIGAGLLRLLAFLYPCIRDLGTENLTDENNNVPPPVGDADSTRVHGDEAVPSPGVDGGNGDGGNQPSAPSPSSQSSSALSGIAQPTAPPMSEVI